MPDTAWVVHAAHAPAKFDPRAVMMEEGGACGGVTCEMVGGGMIVRKRDDVLTERTGQGCVGWDEGRAMLDVTVTM